MLCKGIWPNSAKWCIFFHLKCIFHRQKFFTKKYSLCKEKICKEFHLNQFEGKKIKQGMNSRIITKLDKFTRKIPKTYGQRFKLHPKNKNCASIKLIFFYKTKQFITKNKEKKKLFLSKSASVSTVVRTDIRYPIGSKWRKHYVLVHHLHPLHSFSTTFRFKNKKPKNKNRGENKKTKN